MAQKLDGRVAYADLLRSFATLAVIVLHLAGSQLGSVSVGSPAWDVFNLYDGLVRWCVPVFVMLSGMFLLDPKRSLPLPKLLFHNALRIFISLLFWGGIYALAELWEAGKPFSWDSVQSALLGVLRGNTHYHLWFLFMILGLYLITPVLRAFVRGAGRGDFLWLFLLCFLFASLLPTAFRLWPNATAVIRVWYDRLSLQAVLGYAGFYVAGYYLKEFTIGRLTEAVIYILGALGAFAAVWGTRVLSLRAGGLDDTLYGYFAPNVVCFAVAVFVLFRYVLGVSEERSRRQSLNTAARVSFGMYLVHDLFLMLLRHFSITTLSFAPALAVPVLAAAVFFASFLVSWLLSKLPFLGRWLT